MVDKKNENLGISNSPFVGYPDMRSPMINSRKNSTFSPIQVTPSNRFPIMMGLTDPFYMNNNLESPNPVGFILSNRGSPHPSAVNKSLSKINNIFRSGQKKNKESNVTSEALKDRIKPSNDFLKNFEQQGPGGHPNNLNNEGFLKKSQNIYSRDRGFSFIDHDARFGQLINTPIPIPKTSPSDQIKDKQSSVEMRQSNSKEFSPADKSVVKNDHRSKCEKALFDKLEYHIFNNDLNTLFRSKKDKANTQNIFKTGDSRQSSNKKNILNENIIRDNKIDKTCQDLLVCPVPNRDFTKSSRLGSNINNKIYIQNNINLNSSTPGKNNLQRSAINDLIDFNQQNKMEQDIHRQLVNILRKNLTEEKLLEIVKNTTQRFSKQEEAVPPRSVKPKPTLLKKRPSRPLLAASGKSRLLWLIIRRKIQGHLFGGGQPELRVFQNQNQVHDVLGRVHVQGPQGVQEADQPGAKDFPLETLQFLLAPQPGSLRKFGQKASPKAENTPKFGRAIPTDLQLEDQDPATSTQKRRSRRVSRGHLPAQ